MLPKPRHIIAVIALIMGAIAILHTGFADGLRLVMMITSFSVLVLVFSISLVAEGDATEKPIEIDWKKPLDEIL